MIKELLIYIYENDVTQAKLAKEIGCTPPYLSRVLNNRQIPSDRFIHRVNKLLKSKGIEQKKS